MIIIDNKYDFATRYESIQSFTFDNFLCDIKVDKTKCLDTIPQFIAKFFTFFKISTIL